MAIPILNHHEVVMLDNASLCKLLETKDQGLSDHEASIRLQKYGLNTIHKRSINFFSILLRQITGNPLLIILACATFVSYTLGQTVSSYYVFGMIVSSITLGLWNEYSAEKTIDVLLKRIAFMTIVKRNGEKKEIPASHLTIGDHVLLSEGTIVPADIRLTQSYGLEINQSSLTGESKTIFKSATPLPSDTKEILNFTNIAYMGTTVKSGSAEGVVIAIGKDTQYGKIAKSAVFIKPTTDFQKGLAKFGNLIIKIILILTIGIFLVNSVLRHPFLESLLFSLAIAVGLTPELLPVIVTISLSHGAGKLLKKHVVAKQLIAIENLGNMDVLCTDKTGTLTEGEIQVVDSLNAKLAHDSSVFQHALLCNSAIVHHRIIGNSIDTALWKHAIKEKITINPTTKKIFEMPFDYNKKLMFSVVEEHGETTLIVKGAPARLFSILSKHSHAPHLLKECEAFYKKGYRVIALATKKVEKKPEYDWDDIKNADFQGFVTFFDIPQKSVKDALIRLRNLNVNTIIVTGDNELVTQKVCKDVGEEYTNIVLGSEIDTLPADILKERIQNAHIIARTTPDQKQKVIQILREAGHIVGYMGDGINDIPALRAADVGISVNSAVDVTKDAASLVLLRKSLHVLADGIMEGRKTFSNTMKYILMSTSSNFGNMFSAAFASVFLPFLPMTPVQILLNNALYDVSQMSIPTDNVDAESLIKPRHWNIDFIKAYMIFFGPISSLFDFLTFFIMIRIFHATGALFQTGWFIESLATQILVIFVIRTSRSPFFVSKPSFWVALTSLGTVGLGILIPFTPFAHALGFLSPPPLYFALLTLLIISYLILVESLKSVFLKRYHL